MMASQDLFSLSQPLLRQEVTNLECPDCQSLLTIYYDETGGADHIIYQCENCDQQLSARELADDKEEDRTDNNINTFYSELSCRRLLQV